MLQRAIQHSQVGIPLEKPRLVVLLNDGERCIGRCTGFRCPSFVATAYIIFNRRKRYSHQQQDGCAMLTDFHLGDPKATRRNNLKRS